VRYPHNSLAPEAKKALAELNKPKPAGKSVEEARNKPSVLAGDETGQTAPQKKAGLCMVTGIRHWSTPDYTRVAIDVDGEVKYEAGRVADPDRIFFDLPDTKLASVLVGKSFDVQDGFLKKIRVAQYQPGSTRVVLEVADVANYSAFVLPNPYRLIIDIHGRQSQTQVAKVQPSELIGEDDFAPAGTSKSTSASPSNGSGAGTKQKPTSAANGNAGNGDPSAATRMTGTTASRKASSNPSGRKVIVDEDEDSVATPVPVANSKPVPTSGKPAAKSNSVTLARSVSRDDSLLASAPDTPGPEVKATTEPTSAPTAVAVPPPAKTA